MPAFTLPRPRPAPELLTEAAYFMALYLSPQTSLPSLARQHDMTDEALLARLASPQFRASRDAYEQASLERARAIAAAALPLAIEALADVLRSQDATPARRTPARRHRPPPPPPFHLRPKRQRGRSSPKPKRQAARSNEPRHALARARA